MKRIAITGSSGFIGRYVAHFLQERGYAVYPLRIALRARNEITSAFGLCETKPNRSECSSYPSKKHHSQIGKGDEEDRLGEVVTSPNAEVISLRALSDPQAILAQIKTIRPDTLLHLAWETTPGVYWHAPSNLDWLKSSLDLIEAFALNGGKRVVIAGSCAEMAPHTLYGACKESLRLCAENFLSRQNVSFAWGRIFSPYGPHEKEERLIPSLIQKLLDKEPFHCLAQEHVRDFLFVEDVAAAFAALVDSAVVGIVDIGSGVGIRVGDLALHIAHHLQAEKCLTFASAQESPDNPSALIADKTRLTHEVGFKPKYTLQEGIQKTITWWKNEIYH